MQPGTLVLSRNVGEVIVIGDDIEIKIVGIDGDRVRLGVKAPKEVPVDRLEIRLAKDAGRAARPAGGQ